MATAGYLITRAAERPAILSLGTAIVAVRFFGLARPLSRYAERLASHDVALRALGEPDAFLAADLVLRRVASSTDAPLSARALEARAEAWRPWRGYAVLHLWRAAANAGG